MASNIDNIKVEISVVLGRSVIPMHQLLRMGRGAVIELDSHQDDPVTILANDKPVAKGEIQIHGDKIGVSIVDLIGKPIVPVRQNKQLLEKPDAVERLLRIETELSKDPSAAARAGHLQIVARRVGADAHA